MRLRNEDTILHAILLINDLIGSFLCLILASLLFNWGITDEYNSYFLKLFMLVLLITAIVNAFYSPIEKFTSRGIVYEIKDVAIRQIIIIACTILSAYLLNSAGKISRSFMIGYYVLSCLVLLGFRLLVKRFLLKRYPLGNHVSHMIIVTEESRLSKILEKFEQSKDWRRIIDKAFSINNISYDEIVEYAVHNEVDEFFVSIPDVESKAEYVEFIAELVGMGVKVDIDIDQFELNTSGKKKLETVGSMAVVSIAKNTILVSRRIIKRLIDICGALFGMIPFVIAYIILGPLIKLDSEGPIIFVQKRVGKNGRIFDFYKFRSMYSDAEERKQELLKHNEINGLMFKIENDPRITRIGKFLRKTSIDELPQFINVLKGDMSLVGTRPPTVDEYKQYKPWHKCRLSMKPGITGLWQVSGRSDVTDFDDVLKYDMEYIDNWSLSEDVRILLKTIMVVLGQKGSK